MNYLRACQFEAHRPHHYQLVDSSMDGLVDW